MNESLDDFIRDAMQEHDGREAARPGALTGHTVEALEGRGGMGSVYRARQQSLERVVAVKVMTARARTPEMAERFRREALVLARLEHPNIVPIHDLGMDENGQLYYTMKLVKGRTLAAILCDLREGDAATLRQHTLSSLLTVFRKVCDGLAFAHSHGVLHRDLKPENVMVGEFGEVLVMDWGLAKRMNDEIRMTNDEFPALDAPHSTFDIRHSSFSGTLAGAVMGTPQYMSPEQAMGRIDELDERSDIFSLGGILYAILTLRPPVEAATLQEVLEKVRAGIITPLSVSGSTVNGVRRRAAGEVPEAKQSKLLPHLPGGRVPLALAAVAMKALSLDKANRYSRVGALSADIEAWQGGFATSAEKAGRLKQMRLLMLRHKAVTASLAALLLVSIGFLLKVMASERRAVANEQTAVQEKDSTRRALARAQIALADAAVRDCDGAAARAALRSVPEDLRDTNWDYLIARSDTSLATLRTATTGAISAVAPHPRQAGVFAIAGEDGGIALTNARTGTRLLEFQSNLPGVRGGRYLLSFSSDGAELAVGNLKASVIAFFSARDGGKLREWATPPPFSIEFRPAERQLLVTPQDRTEDKDLRLCDAETGAVVWSFESDSAWFRTAFHPSGQSVVVASGSSRLQLLDASDGHEIRALPDSAQYVHSLAVSPDGELAACGDEQGGVLCVRLKDGQSILRFRPDPSTARQILFTPESHRFVTLSYPDIRSYNQLRVWDASDGYLLQSLLGADDAPLFASIHPLSGELVVTGGTTKSWNISRDEPGWTLPSTVNGPWVSFCGSDDHLLFWDSSSKPQVTRIVADASTTTCWQGGVFLFPTASVSADGRTGLAGNHSAGTFTQIAIDAGGVRELAHWTTSAPLRRFLRLSPDGERVWTGSKMLAAATGREQYSLFPEAGGHLTDGQWISASRVIAAWADGERSILALAGTLTGKTLRTAMHGSRILTIAASPGGKLIAEAGRDKLVRLRDPETLAVRREFRAHDDGITALAFHPLEPVLATASDDLTLRLWNWETGAMLEEIRGLEVSPVSLSWSPGGRRLASAGIDRFVRVWEPRTMNAGSARP